MFRRKKWISGKERNDSIQEIFPVSYYKYLAFVCFTFGVVGFDVTAT